MGAFRAMTTAGLLRGSVMGVWLATTAMSVALAGPAAAQERASVAFDIPAQDLTEALLLFGRQSGVQVTADAGLVSGRAGGAVSGSFTPAEALSRLLGGSGLTYRFIGPRAVRIEAAPTGGIQLGAVRVEGSGDAGPATRTEGLESYAPVAVSVGKTAQYLREIPQSVTVITRQRLDDQALVTLDDVLLQTTGVTRNQEWLASTYVSRGLTIENVRYDGGASSTYLSSSGNEDTAQFDSVALLRGADGLFGAGEAGGVINLTYKRPLAETAVRGLAQAGSWDNYRVEADVTGPLAFDGRLRGRLVGAYQDQASFVDYKGSTRGLGYGALELDLTADTLLFAAVSWQDDELRGFNSSLSRYSNGADIGFPRSKNMGTPWNRIDRENTAYIFRIEQRLGDDWTVKLNLRRDDDSDVTNAAEMENSVDPITLTGTDWWYFQKNLHTRQFTTDLNATGSFDLFGRRHDVIVGLDNSRTDQHYDNLWTYIGPDNVFNPTIPAQPAFPITPWSYQNDESTRRTGIYGSLRLRPVDRLSVILGGRYTLEDKTQSHDMSGALVSELKQDNVFVPYAGVVYDLTDALTAYASYAEIYQSQADKRSGPLPGAPLEPITGTNYEIGLKGELASGRLTGSLAFYRVEKEGESANDPAYPTPNWGDPCCYIRDGLLTSQGIDLELNGEVLPGWQVAFGYTFNENKNVRQSDDRFSSITPKHLLKLWTDYRFNGRLEGLSLGGGVTAQSSNYRAGSAQLYNPVSGKYDGDWVDYAFSEPGYAIWSARVGYEFNERWELSANLNNIFDKTYYGTVSSAGYGNFYGDPRNVVVTLRASF